MVTTKQYCTFRLGELVLGVDVLAVQEVLRGQEMTPVPRASAAVRGLINLRGQIVTALDLGGRLKLARDGTAATMNVIVGAADEPVSLLVDEIGDVVQADESSFEAAPENLPEGVRAMLAGVQKLEDCLLLVLDLDRVLAAGAAAAAPAGA